MNEYHEREVVDRGSNTVAVVAIVVLLILAVLAVMAFGGLAWLRTGGGGGRVNPTAQPTMSAPTLAAPTLVVPTVPPPASYWSPGGAAAG